MGQKTYPITCVVFTREEVKAILARLDGTKWLMASLLYGSGLRLLECVRLRVKDLDFDYNQIIVRDAKGQKDRRTMLPISLKEPLKKHLDKVKVLHQEDLREGFGKVYLPSIRASLKVKGTLWIACKCQIKITTVGEDSGPFLFEPRGKFP